MLLQDMYLKEFIKATASNQPVPGGGSVSAYCASIGVALAQMVASLTAGKKGYENVSQQMLDYIPILEQLQDQFLNDIDRDSDSFDAVMQAFKLPKESEQDKQIRRASIQEATKNAALVPMQLAEKIASLFPICEFIATNGNKNALSDICVATMLLRTGLLGALYNVRINLTSLPQSPFTESMYGKVAQLEEYAIAQEKNILSQVKI
ncbi:MAG: cyclodeaminase/cyclohydrolase family protein [Clostridia bacterium]|nr:cyclodeaminase/cyclohydrolase family protein [Clostridia bacterium]